MIQSHPNLRSTILDKPIWFHLFPTNSTDAVEVGSLLRCFTRETHTRIQLPAGAFPYHTHSSLCPHKPVPWSFSVMVKKFRLGNHTDWGRTPIPSNANYMTSAKLPFLREPCFRIYKMDRSEYTPHNTLPLSLSWVPRHHGSCFRCLGTRGGGCRGRQDTAPALLKPPCHGERLTTDTHTK